jgi:hypothetical protein
MLRPNKDKTMNLGKLITTELRRLGTAQHHGEGVRTFTLGGTDGMPVVRLELADLDRYSAALHRITVGAAFDPPASHEAARTQLSSIAQAVIEQLDYLEEPLAVVESDAGEGTGQVRSNPPQRDENELSYWEVLLNLSSEPGASLTRYRWAPELPEREVQPYPVAFAHLGRIAESLAAALRATTL